jgi:hypothetical protein
MNEKYYGRATFVVLCLDSADLCRKTMAARNWNSIIMLHIAEKYLDVVCSQFAVRYIPHCVLTDKSFTVVRNYEKFRAGDAALLDAQL